MDYALTPEAQKAQQEARKAAEGVVAASAASRDADRRFPESELRELAKDGWMGMLAGTEAGGRGWSHQAACLAITEFSRACASIGLLIGFHNFIVSEAIARHGSEELRSTYLPKLATGEILGAAAFFNPATQDQQEPPACAHLTTKGYRLQGTKPFVPGAIGADLFLVYASTEVAGSDDPNARVLLLVKGQTPGLTVGSADPLVGVRASGTASLRFEDCVVGPSMRIGEIAETKKKVKDLLAAADLVVASQAVGIGTAAFEKAVERAAEREIDDTLIGSHQSVQFMIADMLVQLDASRLLIQRAADERDDTDTFAYAAAQAKAFAGRAAVETADRAIQILGGDGSLADYGIERHWRDAKTCELNPSTREAAYFLVARHLLEEKP
jgi:alkylation response protein AidB-like acyl-CoA dehydrogenase